MECLKSVKGFLTAGKNYDLIRETELNFIVISDDGTEMGFSKSRFVNKDDFYLDIEEYNKMKSSFTN